MNASNSRTLGKSSSRQDEGVKEYKETGESDKLTSYEKKMNQPLEQLIQPKKKD